MFTGVASSDFLRWYNRIRKILNIFSAIKTKANAPPPLEGKVKSTL